VNSIVSGLTHLSGWVAYTVIGALVFGETAIFLGFVLPGETAAVLGGVLASRGHLSLATLCAVVVVTAVTGPLVGYEIGRRTGDRLFAARALRRVPGGAQQARSVLRERGGLAVLLGRFVAFLRAVMPAAAGAVQVPYRTFLIYNVAGGIIWGVGYCLLGYLAGSAYSAVESRVGAGLAIVVAAVVVAAVVVWTVRRHRAARAAPARAAASDSAAAPASNAAPDSAMASDSNAVTDSASAPGSVPVPDPNAAPSSAVAPGEGAAELPNPQPVARPADQGGDPPAEPAQFP
jgi:membrane-associated protein